MRALLWRRRLWLPFQQRVRRWLTEWRPDCGHLVLVGPSAGYALSLQFLERFTRLSVLEPDPLARWLLRRRFPGVGFAWEESRYLAHDTGFSRLVAAFPDAAFLFCNLLGQELQGRPPGFRRSAWLARLEPALAGHPWASWHDIVSTTRRPAQDPVLRLDGALPLEQLLPQFWPSGELEVHDHETAGLCPQRPRQYAIWHLAPRSFHLIEWISNL
jgi:hypothetical protein